MLGIIFNCWALFLGMGLIMLGNGLQATLLGVRASIEDFGTTITGLVMSGYFLGLIAGCNIVPKMVGRVGHVRTFGALASLHLLQFLYKLSLLHPGSGGRCVSSQVLPMPAFLLSQKAGSTKQRRMEHVENC